MSLKIHCLLHSELGGDIHLPHWAASRGHGWQTSPAYDKRELPRPEHVDCLVVMGGPMSVWEEDKHPWLKQEKQLLEDFLRAGRPILGICLGAQLLAEVLGARVYRGEHREIGWFPVKRTLQSLQSPIGALLPDSFDTFLWHGDTFDLPGGATHLLSSDRAPHQAFSWEQALALQFHLEATPDWVQRLISRDADQLQASSDVQSLTAILAKTENAYRAGNLLLEELLDAWLTQVIKTD